MLLSRKFGWGGAAPGWRQSSFDSLSEGLASSERGIPDPRAGRELQCVISLPSLAQRTQHAQSLQPRAARAPRVLPFLEVTSCSVVARTGESGVAQEYWGQPRPDRANGLTFPARPLQQTTAVLENLMRTRCWPLANFLRVVDWSMAESSSQSARWAGPPCGPEVQVGVWRAVWLVETRGVKGRAREE